MSRWRPRPKGIIIVGLVLIVITLVVGFILRSNHSATDISIGSVTLHTSLATTDPERKQGLSGVETLATNQGLLMVFPSTDEWGIWMKDMKIPLDIVWLNNEKKVIYTVIDASPNLGTSKIFYPTDPALYVIEVPAGTLKRADIKVGDTTTFTAPEGE